MEPTGDLEPTRDERQERTRKTMRMLAIAAGAWFLGSGIWGLITETPADRAVTGCETAALARAESGAGVQHTSSRQDQVGWVVVGEVRESVDSELVVTHTWECTADAEGRGAAISSWTPAA